MRLRVRAWPQLWSIRVRIGFRIKETSDLRGVMTRRLCQIRSGGSCQDTASAVSKSVEFNNRALAAAPKGGFLFARYTARLKACPDTNPAGGASVLGHGCQRTGIACPEIRVRIWLQPY